MKKIVLSFMLLASLSAVSASVCEVDQTYIRQIRNESSYIRRVNSNEWIASVQLIKRPDCMSLEEFERCSRGPVIGGNSSFNQRIVHYLPASDTYRIIGSPLCGSYAEPRLSVYIYSDMLSLETRKKIEKRVIEQAPHITEAAIVKLKSLGYATIPITLPLDLLANLTIFSINKINYLSARQANEWKEYEEVIKQVHVLLNAIELEDNYKLNEKDFNRLLRLVDIRFDSVFNPIPVPKLPSVDPNKYIVFEQLGKWDNVQDKVLTFGVECLDEAFEVGSPCEKFRFAKSTRNNGHIVYSGSNKIHFSSDQASLQYELKRNRSWLAHDLVYRKPFWGISNSVGYAMILLFPVVLPLEVLTGPYQVGRWASEIAHYRSRVDIVYAKIDELIKGNEVKTHFYKKVKGRYVWFEVLANHLISNNL
jgi:hypothetical protein